MQVASKDRTEVSASTLLTIRNRHGKPAPDLDGIVGHGHYVSYFENEHGEQWVFLRHQDAERATVYGGDNGWEPVEVYERTSDQVAEELQASGIRPGSLDRIRSLVDPLVPGLILNEPERTWLHNVWHTSGVFGPRDRQAALVALGQRLALEHATPAMSKHANSTDYRAAMQYFALVIGREAGRRGLDDGATGVLLREALNALPEPV